MTFLSALILGLLGSAHCALMCGGLQSALQQPMVIRSERQASAHLVALNLGRLVTYVGAGLLLSALGFSLIRAINVPAIAQVTRYGTAAILLLIGVQLLFSNRKPFAAFESLGASLWQTVSQVLPAADSNRLTHSFRRGLIWGFMPCGLVYGVLLTTLLSDNLIQGSLIMLGFGLGTLPAMLLTGGLYLKLRSLVKNRAVRVFGAVIFIQGSILMITAPWFISAEFANAHPALMSTVFCLTIS